MVGGFSCIFGEDNRGIDSEERRAIRIDQIAWSIRAVDQCFAQADRERKVREMLRRVRSRSIAEIFPSKDKITQRIERSKSVGLGEDISLNFESTHYPLEVLEG